MTDQIYYKIIDSAWRNKYDSVILNMGGSFENKKNLKTQKGQCEAENTIQWPSEKERTMIYKALNMKLKLARHEPK